jgi:hypothetical protein
MKNPFSESSRLQRQLTKEAKTKLADFDALTVIQEDGDFAQFLVEIDPKYADMDLENKRNIEIVREKYLLYTQQKEVGKDLTKVYEQEIIEELGITISEAEKTAAFADMGKALERLAQKDSVEFQRLKKKLEEYNKVKEELTALEDKFEQAVHMSGREGMAGMKDRQIKLEQAEGKIFFSKAGAKANLGRMFGNRDMAHAVADFKHTYELEGADLTKAMQESKGDIKQAEKLRAQLDALREYLIKDLKLAQGVIEASQRAAKASLNEQVKELSGPDRLDSVEMMDRFNMKIALKTKQRNTGMLTPEETADFARLEELQDLEDLEAKNVNGNLIKGSPEEARLTDLRKAQLTRGKERIKKLELARTLAGKMLEGKGKKGGIDFTRTITLPDGSQEEIRVIDLLTGVDGEIDKDFKKTLEEAIKMETKLVVERASVSSKRIDQFMEHVNPLFEKWRVGGMDSRDKVRQFMVKTLQDICYGSAVNPALKVQLKAFLAQRGLNPVRFVIP